MDVLNQFEQFWHQFKDDNQPIKTMHRFKDIQITALDGELRWNCARIFLFELDCADLIYLSRMYSYLLCIFVYSTTSYYVSEFNLKPRTNKYKIM